MSNIIQSIIKAKQKYYALTGKTPTGIKLSLELLNEIKLEAKYAASESHSISTVNGLKVEIDNSMGRNFELTKGISLWDGLDETYD